MVLIVVDILVNLIPFLFSLLDVSSTGTLLKIPILGGASSTPLMLAPVQVLVVEESFGSSLP